MKPAPLARQARPWGRDIKHNNGPIKTQTVRKVNSSSSLFFQYVQGIPAWVGHTCIKIRPMQSTDTVDLVGVAAPVANESEKFIPGLLLLAKHP